SERQEKDKEKEPEDKAKTGNGKGSEAEDGQLKEKPTEKEREKEKEKDVEHGLPLSASSPRAASPLTASFGSSGGGTLSGSPASLFDSPLDFSLSLTRRPEQTEVDELFCGTRLH